MNNLREQLEAELEKFDKLAASKRNSSQFRIEKSTIRKNGKDTTTRFVVDFADKERK